MDWKGHLARIINWVFVKLGDVIFGKDRSPDMMATLGKQMYYQRVAILYALILGIFPLLVMWKTSLWPMFAGMFDIRSWWHMVLVTLVATTSIWLARTLCVVVEEAGLDRFGVNFGGVVDGGLLAVGKFLLWLVMILAIPFVCLWFTFESDGNTRIWWGKFVGAILGFGFGILLITGMTWLFVRYLTDKEDNRLTKVTRVPCLPVKTFFKNLFKKGGVKAEQSECDGSSEHLLQRLINIQWNRKRETKKPRRSLLTFTEWSLGKGWKRQDGEHFLVCHRFAMVFMLVNLAATMVFGALAHSYEFPVFLFVLLGFNFLFQVFSVITFIADRWHFPALLLVVLLLWILSWTGLGKVDQVFETRLPEAPAATGEDYGGFAETPANLLKNASNGVVTTVTAEGGGIHSGVWTCHVLASLQRMCREQDKLFGETIVAGGGVSGGTYGLMYWMDAYTEGKALPNDDELSAKTTGRAMRSSLGYAVRGMVYNDFPPLQSKTRKWFPTRSLMLERAWKRDFVDPGDTLWLSKWAQEASAGDRPAMLFNTTSVETGQPVVFASSQTPNFPERWGATEVWPGMDVSVVSATRCSASFPYVTPVARPATPPKTDKPTLYYLADGGYFENTGVLTMTHWLRSALGIAGNEPAEENEAAAEEEVIPPSFPTNVHTIVWVRILEGTPDLEENLLPETAPTGRPHQLEAPVQTLLNVRSKGSRRLADRAIKELTSDIKHLSKVKGKGPALKLATFVYPERGTQALSWHLTPKEMCEIAAIRFDGRCVDVRRPYPDLSQIGKLDMDDRNSKAPSPSQSENYGALKKEADIVLKFMPSAE